METRSTAPALPTAFHNGLCFPTQQLSSHHQNVGDPEGRGRPLHTPLRTEGSLKTGRGLAVFLRRALVVGPERRGLGPLAFGGPFDPCVKEPRKRRGPLHCSCAVQTNEWGLSLYERNSRAWIVIFTLKYYCSHLNNINKHSEQIY